MEDDDSMEVKKTQCRIRAVCNEGVTISVFAGLIPRHPHPSTERPRRKYKRHAGAGVQPVDDDADDANDDDVSPPRGRDGHGRNAKHDDVGRHHGHGGWHDANGRDGDGDG